ncbi:MAG: hypothetical protein MUP81_02195 [Dehalococcoidia bacterium]|nr:hypothetical protein [Dehalococcoidia bacterium]
MPAGFDACRKGGGKIRTITLKGGKYMHICSLEGKSYKGEIKSKKSEGEGGSPVAAAIKHNMKKR